MIISAEVEKWKLEAGYCRIIEEIKYPEGFAYQRSGSNNIALKIMLNLAE